MNAMREGGPQNAWNATARFIVWVAILMSIWETLQLPLYTLWRTASWQQQLFALVHCTAGDIAIATCALIAVVLLTNREWPNSQSRAMQISLVTIGVSYTLYSEWINLARGAWAYSSWMPTVPWIGTGLAPLLQWIIVPPISLALASRRARFNRQRI